jgi:L-rhamnose isomerase
VSDKISSLLAFFDIIPLHITRPVRWDSDHVVLFEDEIKEIAIEIVRNNALDRVLIGLDFFDASINRVAAWVIGARNVQKALLYALLQPNERMRELQDKGMFTELMALQEEMKTYPFGDVWEHYCKLQKVPHDQSWFDQIKKYEAEVLSNRN